MVPPPGLEPGSGDYKSPALTFVLRGSGRRGRRSSRLPPPGDGALGRTRTAGTRFRRAVLYPLSYEGVEEMVSHGGYHVVEDLAYDQRDQRDAQAAHRDDLLVIHVPTPSPSVEKEGSLPGRHGGASFSLECLQSRFERVHAGAPLHSTTSSRSSGRRRSCSGWRSRSCWRGRGSCRPSRPSARCRRGCRLASRRSSGARRASRPASR